MIKVKFIKFLYYLKISILNDKEFEHIRNKRFVSNYDFAVVAKSRRLKFFSSNFKSLKVFDISAIIENFMIDKFVFVYNGYYYFKLYILPDMVGFKIGEFIFTKQFLRNIHSNNKLEVKKRKKTFAGKMKKKKIVKGKKKIIKKK